MTKVRLAVASAGVAVLGAATILASSGAAGATDHAPKRSTNARVATSQSPPALPAGFFVDSHGARSWARVGDTVFVLAPGTGPMARPDVLCLAVDATGPMDDGQVCASTAYIAREGLRIITDRPDGSRRVDGYAPGLAQARVATAKAAVANDFYTVETTAQQRSMEITLRSGKTSVIRLPGSSPTGN